MGSPWKIFVAFACIFMAGTVFGGFFAMGIGRRILSDRQQPPAPPQLLRQYLDRLRLTDEQRTKIKPIVDTAEMDVRTIQMRNARATAAELKPIIEKAENAFEKELTAEQKTILADLKKRRQPFEGGRGGGFPGQNGGNPGARVGPPGQPGGRGTGGNQQNLNFQRGQRGPGPSGPQQPGNPTPVPQAAVKQPASPGIAPTNGQPVSPSP